MLLKLIVNDEYRDEHAFIAFAIPIYVLEFRWFTQVLLHKTSVCRRLVASSNGLV